MDVSEARGAEAAGVQFRDLDGQVKPALQIVRDHRYNWVRVRLMIDPGKLEIVSERLNEAKVDLGRQQAAVDGAEKAAFEAQQQRAALDGRIRQLARTAYTGGNSTMNQLDVLLSSGSAEELVSQMGTLEAIAGHASAAVTEVAGWPL